MHSSISKQKIIYGIGAVVVLLVVFRAGEIVGYHKATFAFRGGDNYYRAFENRKPAIPARFPEAHGTVGEIVSVEGSTVIVADRGGTEKQVHLGTTTSVRRARTEIAGADLVVGDVIIVVGRPNEQGIIEASLIRVLPPPPEQVTVRISQ